MVIKRRKRYICLVMVFILFFLGMGIDVSNTDSSFSYNSSYINAQETYPQETEVSVFSPAICTLNMIRGGSQSLYNVSNSAIIRYHNKVYFSAFFLIAYLLYRSIYQSSECKEDGQLFLCRSVIIDYIHQKDSGE